MWGFGQKSIASSGASLVSSQATSLTGVASSGLLCISYSSYNPSGATFTCSDGHNTYTAGQKRNYGSVAFIESGSFWAPVVIGGSLTITISASINAPITIGATAFTVAPGSTVSFVTGNNNQTAGTTQDSGNLIWSGPGNFLMWGASSNSDNTVVASTGLTVSFTQGNVIYYSTGLNYTDIDEYALNVPTTSSPFPVEFMSGTTPNCTIGMVFLETPGVGPSTSAAPLMAAM